MRSDTLKLLLIKPGIAAGLILLASGASVAQAVNLSAGPSTTALPDGTAVPMWGFSCDASQPTVQPAGCSSLNGSTSAAVWSPVVITVPYTGTTTSLTINLTNKLSFTPTGATVPNSIPTSLVIVGQLGGGLGSIRTTAKSPAHENRGTTWPITNTGKVWVPKIQADRVQSFATEVAAGSAVATTLSWNNLNPGTYLIQSGTHPSIQVPMGLYGVLVVTAPPTATALGTAYGTGATAVQYNAELPLVFSEIDPWLNGAVNNAVNTVGFQEAATYGPYSSSPVASIQLVSGGTGYTSPPTVLFNGVTGAVTGAIATAVVDLTVGSPTLGQVTSIVLTTPGSYTAAPIISFQGGVGSGGTAVAALALTNSTTCSNGALACYPPVVNYTPFYYLINGVSFDKTNATNSLFPAIPAGTSAAPVTGNLLVRLVNAGLHMHVPAIVGPTTGGAVGTPGFSLIAEDGNVLPGLARVQNEVFMAAGKTYDVMINVPSAGAPALPIYDRELSLSGNAVDRDSGMLAYIGVNGGGVPAAAASNAGAVVAKNDFYNAMVAGRTLTVSNPARGVLANDTNVLGARLLTPPINGQLTLNANGTFTYVPSAAGISLALGSGGIGYSAPVVTIAPPGTVGGTTATATATVGTNGVGSVTVGGTASTTLTGGFGGGYTAPAVTIVPPPGAGTPATASPVVAYGASFSVSLPGTTCVSPSVAVSVPNVAGGTPATVQATAAAGSMTITSTPGSGYTTAPTVTITDSGGTCNAAITASTAPGTGVITSVMVTNSGSGYTAAPAVTIADSTGTGATGTANLGGIITSLTVTYIGSGYTTVPSVTITGSGGTGASATATIIPGNSTSDSFVYQASNKATVTATVTLGATNITDTGVACSTTPPLSFSSNVSSYIAVKPPGLLATCTDGAGLPLSIMGATPASATQQPVPATVTLSSVSGPGTGSVSIDANGGFTANVTAAGSYTFSFSAQTALGKVATATATLNFPVGNGPTVTILDGASKQPLPIGANGLQDYRWIIEEDRTFFIDPTCSLNLNPGGTSTGNCKPVTPEGAPPFFGTNFHTSHMPIMATGCTGQLSCESLQTLGGVPAVCDVGNGACRVGSALAGLQTTDPTMVHLDPSKRYYISVLPGDAAQPFISGFGGQPDCTAAGHCGHGMGGAQIAPGQGSVTVFSQPSPYPTAKLSVFVFQDDYPLDGEHNAGGGIDVLSPQEPGLGSFNVTLFDVAGGTGDSTGQPTYDMFNQPLSNSLAGTIDPRTGNDACPISQNVTQNALLPGLPATPAQCAANPQAKGCQKGITSMIVTCPTYESDGVTLSPLAGQAVVANLYPGRYTVVATPGSDRIARGEEWLQTNTLDGQKGHDAFLRIGEPGYFQEFGPAGYHVTIGFANPKVINDRLGSLCANLPAGSCTNKVDGQVTTARMSRTPDERLYGSGSRTSFAFTQCYVSLGDPDGAEFAFTRCDSAGNFAFNGIPAGNWKITVFDQWNDQIVDGISTPVGLGCAGSTLAGACQGTIVPNSLVHMGEMASHQWQANIYTRTFLDDNGNGVSDANKAGLALVPTNIRFRDGSFSNFNNTDLNGYAAFNEVFPLFSWYMVETDSTRFKSTGTHVVYDSGGPVDGSSPGGTACLGNMSAQAPCGSSNIGDHLANTFEKTPLPPELSVPGAVYCAEGADCTSSRAQFALGNSVKSLTTNNSTGRIDPPFWFGSYGWQGYAGQNNFLEFGKKPFVAGETGGIHGHVVYSSTRPFDDPQFLTQLSWEPMVPHVRINLYTEGVTSDGVTPTLTLVDHTDTSSFDDWAQGFRLGADGTTPVSFNDKSGTACTGTNTPAGCNANFNNTVYVPNISCPGQSTSDVFFYGLRNQPEWLDLLMNGAGNTKPLPYQAQFKCYDGMHTWNQLQPAPYDGMFSFPSVTAMDPNSGKPTATNCTACVTNPDNNDPYRYGGSTTPGSFGPGSAGMPMLPPGKYVVEVVVPQGYELVKEEDKNILIGDNFIAPVAQQFAGFGNVFILPDQAAVGAAYNPNNPQNQTMSLGANPNGGNDAQKTQSQIWPCAGAARVVPDFMSLFPGSAEVAPFAGATRNLCDRKEVTLTEQVNVLTDFFIYTSTHAASHFTGIISDDFTGEFDPFSPQFGEKFSPPNLPVSIKDWSGNEVGRTYADAFGTYNGLSYSTWEVNPPNPTGYAPTMMVVCMNDSGSDTPNPPASWAQSGGLDPKYQPGYSQFCYELPFMPGQTGYFDTPVVPTAAFSEGFNHPDCAYPDATPAIASVTSSDLTGPWVNAPVTSASTLTINALGNQIVENYGYSGPSATAAPYNQSKVTRHYGFGSQCTAVGTSCAAVSSVTIGGVPATITGWSDTTLTVTVPSGVPACAVQQQAQYMPTGTSAAQCGQLVITNGNGKTSIDAVTVTIGGKKPTLLTTGQTIQSAIDAAMPGDMIILPAGKYTEMVLMWKPVRLQGVGAASSVIDGNPQPAGRLNPWRLEVACLFGLTPNGRPPDKTNPLSCPTLVGTPNGSAVYPAMIVDRLPMESLVAWDSTVNGNLAEQLIEPSLMGAKEGAAVTVFGKGVNLSVNGVGAPDPYGTGAGSAFPNNVTLLTASDCESNPDGTNPYPSNYYCNPSSIDGLSLTNSSQGGGGIFVHGWAHNLQIANNRVNNNTGTMSGGITVGQGEHVDVEAAGVAPLSFPGSCEATLNTNIPGQALPFCYNMNVNVHNNAVNSNSSMGDQLFSSTPAGAGGVSICNGADYYKFTNNWVCGNMSTGDGGGMAHIGFIKQGAIEHNTVVFNQSTNPSITTNGAGVLVMGAPDVDPLCGVTNDQDCVPTPGTVGPSDGTGPGLLINANLILGNAASSGSGGGLRLQHVNGTDVLNFPNGLVNFAAWNSVNVTNNVIANNVAGWDGAGISLQDALFVNIVNNTIVSNDATASAGPLFGSLFAQLASAPVDPTKNVICTVNTGTGSCPQVAGLASARNSVQLALNMPAGVTCPPGHGVNTATGWSCRNYSVPLLYNDVIWQNRSFVIGVGGGFLSNHQSQQHQVTLYNAFTNTQAGSQTATGSCSPIDPAAPATVVPSSYWDLGVRGDTGLTNHSADGFAPAYSALTVIAPYGGSNNLAPVTSPIVSQYCNGSRTPPENGIMGWQVPPGTNELMGAVGGQNPLVFSLAPSATVDEGNNWVNMRWGPLALTSPVTGAQLGNFALAAGSPAIDFITANTVAGKLAPPTDFFGNPRPDIGTAIDIGAIEFQAAGQDRPALNSITPNTATRNQTITVNLVGKNLTGATAVTVNSTNITVAFTVVTANLIEATFNINAFTMLAVHYVNVTTPVGTSNSLPFTVTAPSGAVAPTSLTFALQQIGTTSAPQPVVLSNSGTGPLTIGNLAFGAPNPANFAIASTTCGTLPTTLAVGARCTINVMFTPNGVTLTPTSTLNIALPGAATTPLQVGLGGTTQKPSGSLSPSAVTFAAPQQVGTASAPQALTLSNTGIGPLTINGIALGGTNPGNFAQTNTCGTFPVTLPVGGACTINVTFSPIGSKGPRSAALNVVLQSAVVTPLQTSLSGSAQQPSGSASPASLPPFAAQQLGTTSAAQPVTITNTGVGPLTVGTIDFSGLNPLSFGQTNTCATPIAVGSTCTINVTFTPAGVMAGQRFATMQVHLPNAATTPAVTVSGTGQSASATLAGTPAFGNQPLGTTSAAHAFTYTNTGIGPITISNTGATLTGANASDYAIASDTCITGGVGVTLAPNGTCQIGVTFAPSATGSRAATLTVINAAGGTLNRTAILTGTGTQAAVTFGGGSTVLTSTPATGTAKSVVTTITNGGTAPLVIASISIAVNAGQTNPGSYSAANLGTSACPIGGAGLAAGAVCQVNVTYTPPAGTLNTIAGTLTVTDTGAALATQTLGYTGN